MANIAIKVFLLLALNNALLGSAFQPNFRHRSQMLHMTATDVPPQKFVVNTISSRFDTVKLSGIQSLQGNKNTDVGTLLELRGEEFQKVKVVPQFSLKLLQKTSGPIPRPYLPTLLSLTNLVEKDLHAEALYDIVEEAMRWYLDAGGRVKLLEVACPPAAAAALESMGFERSVASSDVDAVELRQTAAPAGTIIYACSSAKLKEHCLKRLKEKKGHPINLNDIIGRLLHDLGDPRAAAEYYTNALVIDPKSAATFRNLGSAYQAAGNAQLAFASYQQAVQLDEKDALVYLRLAFFYEDFATKDWVDAAEHSVKCFEYYLDNVDPEDYGILSKLGNLLVKENKHEKAIGIFKRIIAVDKDSLNAWFNMAYAQISSGDLDGARMSLERTLELDADVPAATHMLKALDEQQAVSIDAAEDRYVTELFNTYAPIYDQQQKKLLYATPRVMRQELGKIYREKYGELGPIGKTASSPDVDSIEDENAPVEEIRTVWKNGMVASESVTDFKGTDKPVDKSCSTYTSFMNGSLDILDLGCGTGLAGSWLKDYAKNLVGVDLSPEMVTAAQKKMMYQELHVMPLNDYLNDCKKQFDLVAAADVLSYLGDLSLTMKQAASVIKPGGHFIFTAEEAPEGSLPIGRGYRLMRTGRFGYSKEYIDSLVDGPESPYKVTMSRPFSPRLDAGEAVPGFLYILEKK